MRSLPALAALCLLLAACSPEPPLPEEPDININGSYTGRIVSADQRSALLDVTLLERNLAVTANVTSRANGQTLVLTGTRSVYKASPVTANAVLEITAPDSPCRENVRERYAVGMTFYAKTQSRDEGAKGFASHEVCDPETATFKAIPDGTGQLELVRK